MSTNAPCPASDSVTPRTRCGDAPRATGDVGSSVG
jgi:hypothetical protein